METGGKKVFRVGSRKSELALIQTHYVIDCLKKLYPEKEFTLVTMTTLGDRTLNISLPKIGEKALFTKELEDALIDNTVDFVVHSLKDLSTTLPDGLAIGAVFEREDPRDALVLREDFKDKTLATLPDGALIGTSSLRRTAQLHATHPHLKVIDVRGNLNTRLRKLDNKDNDPDFAALLLAKAGMVRMNWDSRISKVLPCSEMMYAVGQGALAVECRADNEELLKMLAPYNHAETYCRVLAERSFCKKLGGGCSAPLGVSTTLKPFGAEFKLSMTGAVWSLDGKTKIQHKMEQIFPQLKKTTKHKLSPTEDGDHKKFKPETNEVDNAVGELNKKISEKGENVNCEDNRKSKQIEAGKILCGMTENTNVLMDVISKCDSLGEDLANALIEKGAIEVMKVTQDYIRSSVASKS